MDSSSLATTTYSPGSGSIQRTESLTYDADSNVTLRSSGDTIPI